MTGIKVTLFVFAFAPLVLAENPCLRFQINYDGDLVPHESDLKLYYDCTNDEPVLKSCSEGMDFNPITKECERSIRSDVRCDPVGKPVCSPHVTLTSAVYLPHETNCTLFYQCGSEITYIHQCPQGYHFSNFKNVCDYPERAKCAC